MKKTFLLIGLLVLATLVVVVLNFLMFTSQKGNVSNSNINTSSKGQLLQATTTISPTPTQYLHVVSISPKDQQTNVPVNTTISIIFNRIVTSNDMHFSFWPSTPFSLTISGNTVTLSPKDSFLANTLYRIYIIYTIPNNRAEVKSFATVGNNPSAVDEFGKRINNSYQDPANILESHTPYSSATFSVSSTANPVAINFYVTLTGADKDKSRQDFINWAKSLGLTDSQIASLDIRYQ